MARLYLVTANIGSVFDSLEHGLPIWLNEFAANVRSKDPEFIAVHFQETGGKDCPNTADSIEVFYRQLIIRMEQLNFRVAEAFVDTRSELKDQYTALSSIYFVHESLRLPVQIWDFQAAKFQNISFPLSSPSDSETLSFFHPNVHMGLALDQTSRKQKEKFPQHFYPNCKWSRKGFLRTRWRLGKTVVDFVNIHLFHDSCNLLAASAFPSPFAQHREKTLKYTLDRIQNDGLAKCPLFIFGDFNFRINGKEVMEILRKDFDRPGVESEIVLATKRFHCPEQELRFRQSFEWLKQHDFESKQFLGLVHEFDLNFHPTYPFDEDINQPERFMRTRLPAWCDRVLFTPSTKDIIVKDFPVDYNLMGSNVCMGDHKPVTLYLKIKTDEQLVPTSLQNHCNSNPTPTNNEATIKVPLQSNHSNSKLGKQEYNRKKCGTCCSMIPTDTSPSACSCCSLTSPTAGHIICCSNENCARRLVMMNLTAAIANHRMGNGTTPTTDIFPIGNSNLSLIALNTESEKKGLSLGMVDAGTNIEGNNLEKISVCWTNPPPPSYNCANGCKSLNTKNLQNNIFSNHNHHPASQSEKSISSCASGKNGCSGLNCVFGNSRTRSASQGSATVQAYKCHLKEGMSRTTTAAGDCVTCSKCVIL